MSRNTIRRSNDIYARKIWKPLAGIVVLAVFGVVFVFLRVQNIQLADDVKHLENAFGEIAKRNMALRLEIERRMKPRALHEKIAEFNLGLVSVADLPKVKAPMISYPMAAYVQKEDAK